MEFAIIVVKNIIQKNHIIQDKNDIFVVVIVMQNIDLKLCRKKNKMPMAQDMTMQKDCAGKRQEKFLIIICVIIILTESRVKFAEQKNPKLITIIMISR